MITAPLETFNKVICALTGKSYLYEKYALSVFQLHPIYDPNIEHVRTILGSKDPKWAVSIYRIVMGEQIAGLMLPSMPESTDLSGLLPEEEEGAGLGTLINTPEGLAAIVPSAVNTVNWPYPSTMTISYDTNEAVEITVGASVFHAPAVVTGTRLRVIWPEELAIRGDIQLEKEGAYVDGWKVKLPILLTYPVAHVIDLITSDSIATSLMEKADVLSDFFLADDPCEKLAILVIALYRLTKYAA